MKPRFIIFVIIFAVILSGCSIENKKATENKNADKVPVKEVLKDSAQSLPMPNNTSAFQSMSVSNKSSSANILAVKKEVQTAKSISLNTRLFNYLSTDKNRNSIAKRASALHGGTLHNSCVYYASESLRRIGVKIPDSMSLIPQFINELKKQGFKTSYNLKDLKPGDICFTTDMNGVVGGRPTHTYIFMGWDSPGVARIVDNQLYDYGNVYHARLIGFYYLNNQRDKPKEATAFFMYK